MQKSIKHHKRDRFPLLQVCIEQNIETHELLKVVLDIEQECFSQNVKEIFVWRAAELKKQLNRLHVK